MKINAITINGEPVRLAAIIDVVSPFTAGWSVQDVAAFQRSTASVEMSKPAIKKLRRFLAGQHLPRRLRVGNSWFPSLRNPPTA